MDFSQNASYEKREHARIGLETQVSIKSMRNHSMMLGWIQDISYGGFKVRVDIPLNFNDFFCTGDDILFETYVDFFKLKGKGNIRWASAEKDGIGIKFKEFDNGNKRFLDDFLKIFS